MFQCPFFIYQKDLLFNLIFFKNIYWKKKVLLEKFYNVIKAWENLSLIL